MIKGIIGFLAMVFLFYLVFIRPAIMEEENRKHIIDVHHGRK